MLFINEDVAKKMFLNLDEDDAIKVRYALDSDDPESEKPLAFEEFYTYLHNAFVNAVMDDLGISIEDYEDIEHPLLNAPLNDEGKGTK